MLVHNEYSHQTLFSALRTSEENRAGPLIKVICNQYWWAQGNMDFVFKWLNVFNIYYMDYHGFNLAVLS